MDWVVNAEGEPYLCPLRGTHCTKRCALYGTATVEKQCAFAVIADALVHIYDYGLDVKVDDGDK